MTATAKPAADDLCAHCHWSRGAHWASQCTSFVSPEPAATVVARETWLTEAKCGESVTADSSVGLNASLATHVKGCTRCASPTPNSSDDAAAREIAESIATRWVPAYMTARQGLVDDIAASLVRYRRLEREARCLNCDHLVSLHRGNGCGHRLPLSKGWCPCMRMPEDARRGQP